jgi:phage shock protein A
MKDEIKEILEFKENADYKKLSVDEIKILEDYITNLQEDLDYQRQAEIDYNKKHTKLMRKYKKLQQENERLKNDKKKILELIENDYFEDGSFENYYKVLNILTGGDEE